MKESGKMAIFRISKHPTNTQSPPDSKNGYFDESSTLPSEHRRLLPVKNPIHKKLFTYAIPRTYNYTDQVYWAQIEAKNAEKGQKQQNQGKTP